MFATTFYIEREPMSLAELPAAFQSWMQNAGGVAAVGLLIWSLSWVLEQRHKHQGIKANRVIVLGTVGSALLYLALGLLYLGFKVGMVGQKWLPSGRGAVQASLGDILLALAGGLALFTVALPIVMAFVTRIRWQRIWALARVSLKEAIRNRVVLVFAAMALIFLFADYFVSAKAEDQIRNYVRVVYWSIMPLFLLTAGLLGAFSIPNDVKNQSIHTIVTKPVEKFEIVLGRFLGYGILLTVGLAVIAGLSLIYVLRTIHPDAVEESQKARVPIYGHLGFYGTKNALKGDSVGREWEYRSYISGAQPNQMNAPRQYAYWSFPDVPLALGDRQEPVKFEFTFDIFRLNRGQEGKGIYCTFTFVDGRLTNMLEIEQIVKKMQEERTQQQADPANKDLDPKDRLDRINADLIKKYAVIELAGVEVTDYHTQSLKVPPAFFKRLAELEAEKPREFVPNLGTPPMMTVIVNVDRISVQQMLGVARRDLYLLADVRSFEINFLKGIVGMWCNFMLVLGVGIACSTYLSGVISWLCTMFLFGSGLFGDYIRQLAEGRSDGGGPLESAYRIITHSPLAAPIDPGPTASILLGTDEVYRWWLGRFLNLIPDINRYDLHQYVANGFDISWTHLLADNFVPLAGYLLPWAILSFYLMKFREIANPT